MKIGLDYGGVISFSPDRWQKVLIDAIKRGHKIYIISHAQPGSDLQLRRNFADKINALDLSFADLQSGNQEREIAMRKVEICNHYGIEVFIDDDINRVEAVGRNCKRCAALYVPQAVWETGLYLIDGLLKT